MSLNSNSKETKMKYFLAIVTTALSLGAATSWASDSSMESIAMKNKTYAKTFGPNARFYSLPYDRHDDNLENRVGQPISERVIMNLQDRADDNGVANTTKWGPGVKVIWVYPEWQISKKIVKELFKVLMEYRRVNEGSQTAK
jgi:hypothetical protein